MFKIWVLETIIYVCLLFWNVYKLSCGSCYLFAKFKKLYENIIQLVKHNKLCCGEKFILFQLKKKITEGNENLYARRSQVMFRFSGLIFLQIGN